MTRQFSRKLGMLVGHEIRHAAALFHSPQSKRRSTKRFRGKLAVLVESEPKSEKARYDSGELFQQYQGRIWLTSQQLPDRFAGGQTAYGRGALLPMAF